ncbi:MAG: hypothetical protein FJ224_11805 [Lentisphaerae bacterium]|nr:hypothetical protein [Lentisphaerota bacterium]
MGVLALGVGIAALLLLSGWTGNAVVNAALTLAALISLLFLLVRCSLRWERRRSTLSEAFRMEELADDLNSRIVSAVDFLERSESTPLIEVVVNRAREDLERPFERLLDRAKRNRLRLRFALLLVLFLALGSSPWFSFARLGRTVALSATDLRESLFPTRYELFPGPGVHLIGTPIEAGLRFTRFRYPEVTMLSETTDREGVDRTVLSVDAAGRVAVTLDPTLEREYRIRFEFGKRMTEEMTLVFTAMPVIENMQAELVFPLYTRLVPKEMDGILDRITALAGTRINLGFVFSKPLKSAALTLDDGSHLPLDVVGRFASVSFVHSLERRVTLQVEDIHGFVLEVPHAVEFGLTVDRPPKIIVPAFLKTDMPKTLDELAGFTFGAKVEDDFGVAKCVVKWRQATVEEPDRVKTQGDPIERPFIPPRPNVVAAFESIFREQAQRAEPGDLFTFQVEAFDNREPKPQSTVSSLFSIFIRGPDLEWGVAGSRTDVTGGWGGQGGGPTREWGAPKGGSRAIMMPGKQTTAESYKNEFKADRATEVRGEVPRAPDSTAGNYSKAVSGSK